MCLNIFSCLFIIISINTFNLAVAEVKNELVTPSNFIRQGSFKPVVELMKNTPILEKLLESVSDLFNQKERVVGKGIV